jgi:hypothetical protein
MIFVILTIIGILFWIVVEVVNGWNNDPLGNRSDYNRPKNARFKNYYGLTVAQSIDKFEHKMAAGMFCEGREVFVTAFCIEDRVKKVTATIGTDSRCFNSDQISDWPNHAKRLGCIEIRQYHNHPNNLGRKMLSNRDLMSHHQMTDFLKKHGIRFRSFLLYANYFNGWVIREYGIATPTLAVKGNTLN